MHGGVAAEARAASDAQELVAARVEIGGGGDHDRGHGNGCENAAHVPILSGPTLRVRYGRVNIGVVRILWGFHGDANGRRHRAARSRHCRCWSSQMSPLSRTIDVAML